MADFGAKYTEANLSKNAAVYDGTQSLEWRNRLVDVKYDDNASLGILAAILVAQRRGDIVGALFKDVAEGKSDEQMEESFRIVREAILIAAPFVGLPNTIPACFGAIAVLKERGITEVGSLKPRPGFADVDYGHIGKETNAAIYRGVGNAEVGVMIAQYLPELSTYAQTSIFGYVCGGCTQLPLRLVEVIVASSIIGLGASRQARSHCKAAMQVGNSPEAMTAIDSVAHGIAKWNGTPLPEKLDVPQLLRELNVELSKIGGD